MNDVLKKELQVVVNDLFEDEDSVAILFYTGLNYIVIISSTAVLNHNIMYNRDKKSVINSGTLFMEWN